MKNKMPVRAVSFLMVLLFVFTPLGAAGAFSDEVTVFCPDESRDYLSVEIPEGADTDADWDGLVEAIKSAVYCDTEQAEDVEICVNIKSFAIPYTTENLQCLHNYIYNTPELFAVRGGYSYSYSISPQIFTSLYFYGNPAENKRKYAQCEDAIQKLLYGIKGNTALSDVDKCLVMHDRLVAYCEYDYANYLNDTIPSKSYSAYGALVDRVAVCNGYALAYMWLLNELGFENYLVSSSEINHAFTKVIIDSEPYYIDTTWDDPVWDVPGRVKHTNFLLSFATFSANHRNSTDYDQNVTSTIYEDYFSQDTNSQIMYMNGYLYYFRDSVSDSESNAIVRRSADGSESEVLLIDKYYRVTDSGTTWRYSARNIRKFINIGNEIIYTDAKDVRSYNVVTGEQKVIYTPSSSLFPEYNYFLYGLKQVDGTIYVTANNSSNFDADTFATRTESFVYCTHPQRETIAQTPGDCMTLSQTTEICTGCYDITHSSAYGSHNYEWTVTASPDCQNEGVKKEICSICGAVGRTQAIPVTAHTPAQAVSENETAATCTEYGSYESVVYCSVCSTELSRTQESINPTGHNLVYHSGKASTCKVKGYNPYYTCSKCNYTTYSELPLAAHTPAAAINENETAPTCTVQGSYDSVVYCSVCGDELSRTPCTTDALGHNLIHHNGKASTCKVKGYKAYDTCTRCSYTTYEELPLADHTPAAAVKENEIAPTCTANGSYDSVVYCSVCGTELSRTGKTTAATGHSFTNYISDGNATCLRDGTKTAKCDNCNATKTVTDQGSALGHDIVHHNGKASTCKVKGYKAYDTCTRCDYTTYEELPLADHTPAAAVKENEIAPTCTANGSYDSVVYCSVCGDEISRTGKTTDALGHNLVHHNGKASTCKVKGYKAYDTCTRCDYTTYEALPLADHTPAAAVKENEIAPTCTANGSYDSVVYCSVCGDELSRTPCTTDALGHNLIHHNGKASTCKVNGYKAYDTCTRCSYTTYEELPLADHTPADAVKDNEKAATCTEQGSYDSVVYCSVCGDELSREEKPVATLPHDLRYHTGKASTCKEKGYNYIACENCDLIYYEELPLADHTPAAAVKENEIAPTCTANGSYDSVVYCSVCGTELSRQSEVSPATGHKDKDNNGMCDTCGKITDSDKYNAYLLGRVKLRVKSSATVGYRSTVTYKAKAENVPDGFKLAVYDGSRLIETGDRTSVTYEIPGEMTSGKTLTVKVIDKNGAVQKTADGKEISAQTEIKVKDGFFDKLVAFFLGLFGLLSHVVIEP